MKKLLLLTAITTTTLLFAGLAIAGDYHSGVNAVCSDCHTMHFSRSHDMAGGAGDALWALGSNGPNEYLLKAPANELCLSCHDGQSFAPDVLGDHANGYDRAAGALNEDGLASYETWMGHTLGSQASAPGGTTYTPGAHGLECINCHHQHGAGNGYRNLAWYEGTTRKVITWGYGATVDTTKDVWEKANSGVNADHYGQDNVQLLEPNQAKSTTADFCQSCHTDFHGTGVGGTGAPAQHYLRHPAAVADIGAVGGGHSRLTQFTGRNYRVRVMSASGNWGTQGTPLSTTETTLTPTCLSCHKAHGNLNAFGLILPTGTAPIGESGDSEDYKAICKQCHIQGALAT